MIVINSAELRNNMKKYLDTATTETVVVQRGRTETFVLQRKDSFMEMLSETPDDYDRAITGKEVIAGIEKGLKDMIKRKHLQKEAQEP